MLSAVVVMLPLRLRLTKSLAAVVPLASETATDGSLSGAELPAGEGGAVGERGEMAEETADELEEEAEDAVELKAE